VRVERRPDRRIERDGARLSVLGVGGSGALREIKIGPLERQDFTLHPQPTMQADKRDLLPMSLLQQELEKLKYPAVVEHKRRLENFE
jgi:hypothetical protein